MQSMNSIHLRGHVRRKKGTPGALYEIRTHRTHRYLKRDAAGAYGMYERAMHAYSGEAAVFYNAALLFHPGRGGTACMYTCV